jgi:hypothetical protein
MLSRSSCLNVAIVAVIAAQLAALIWAREVRDFETRTLDALGVPVPVRVGGAVVLVGLLGYRYYTQSKAEAARLGQPVIRRSVAIFAIGSVGLVLALAFLASR